ncbi:MAG TPA: flagellar hook assembly protein FlgD [Spirochaetales bacterium]|nr:flagellar hook assembly protein FlgD [Spirochaetales bacterium]HRY55542.1 flagellar hook assembly protein FlgD [Spirochaetia bacterium]HRZ65336.1 flagellar hook assembly protein FlgD [Spirochaetia bacterium]
MDLNMALSGADLARTKVEVDAYNKALGRSSASKPELGKDDFLKILITQLQHQDPTAPMQDKEFIAQMAQFSSLEQMTNMSAGFARLSGLLASSEAAGFLGKNVEIRDGDKLVTGLVEKVVRGDVPLVGVGGRFFDVSQVESVIE